MPLEHGRGRDDWPGWLHRSPTPAAVQPTGDETDSFANGWKLSLWRKGDDQALVGIQANSFVDKITIALA